MKIAIENSVVGIEYEVKEAGTTEIVDSNKGTNQPLEFITGKGHIIPGLEKALEGMAVGEKKTITIPPEEGYGMPDPNNISVFSK
jgi:FKBP-type peptidyl-prolyl cis-trans isomerase SlyD